MNSLPSPYFTMLCCCCDLGVIYLSQNYGPTLRPYPVSTKVTPYNLLSIDSRFTWRKIIMESIVLSIFEEKNILRKENYESMNNKLNSYQPWSCRKIQPIECIAFGSMLLSCQLKKKKKRTNKKPKSEFIIQNGCNKTSLYFLDIIIRYF